MVLVSPLKDNVRHPKQLKWLLNRDPDVLTSDNYYYRMMVMNTLRNYKYLTSRYKHLRHSWLPKVLCRRELLKAKNTKLKDVRYVF